MPAKRLWFSGEWDPALSCGVLSHHKQSHHAGLELSMLRYSHSNQDMGAHSEYGSLQLMSHSFFILFSSFLFGFTSPEPTFVIHLSSWQKAETVTQWKIPLRPAAANTTPEAAGFCRPCPHLPGSLIPAFWGLAFCWTIFCMNSPVLCQHWWHTENGFLVFCLLKSLYVREY